MDSASSDQVTIIIAPRAIREIERSRRNWLARRDKNPALFEEELEAAFENIKAIPAFGSPTTMTSRRKLVRRVEMLKTKHQIFYRQENDNEVRILSVWAGKRGQQPKLR